MVTDPAEKQFIMDNCRRQRFIAEAPMVFVCCADLSTFSRLSERLRYQEFIELGVFDTFSGDLTDHAYWEKNWLSAPEPDPNAFMTLALATTYIAISPDTSGLTATALGLGTCWVQARPATEAFQRYFGWPEHIISAAVVPCGYPAQNPSPRPRLALEDLLLRPIPVMSSP